MLRLLRRLAGHAPDRPATPDTDRDPAWAEPLDASMNLHRVTPTLFRSARLDADDLPQLRSLGIRTVLSLRNFHSDQELLRGSGIRAVRLGANTWAVGDRHVVATMRALRAAEREGPVLLHCLHGADRTGMMVAMYRMLYQNWPRERALAELRHGGYGYHAVWLNIERYLERVDLARIRSAIDAADGAAEPRATNNIRR
jgi:protein tyrosine/serine phosphatase